MEVPTEVHVSLWSNAKQLALPFGRYVALLVSLHGIGLYERYRSWEKSPESARIVQEFLSQEYAFQQELRQALSNDQYYAPDATPEAIAHNQRLVAVWDQLSLILCEGLEDEQQVQDVPIAAGKVTLTLTPQAKTTSQVKVDPWPFQHTSVTLVYEGRRLQQTFADEAEMQQVLRHSPWMTITTKLSPA